MYGEKRFRDANAARIVARAKLLGGTIVRKDGGSSDGEVEVLFENKEAYDNFCAWCERATVVYLYKQSCAASGWRAVVTPKLNEIRIIKDDFEELTGHAPEHDDLERVNCSNAGAAGHRQCGLCEHGKPRFLHCETCLEIRQKLEEFRELAAEVSNRRFFYVNLRFGVHKEGLALTEVIDQMLTDSVDQVDIITGVNDASALLVGQTSRYANGYLVRLADAGVKEYCNDWGPNHVCHLPKGHEGDHKAGANWGCQSWPQRRK